MYIHLRVHEDPSVLTSRPRAALHSSTRQVTLSSLNRHAVATREDVGTPKATCLEKHFKQILPEVGPGWDISRRGRGGVGTGRGGGRINQQVACEARMPGSQHSTRSVPHAADACKGRITCLLCPSCLSARLRLHAPAEWTHGVEPPFRFVLSQHAVPTAQADLEAVVEMYTAEREEELLGGPVRPDYVIDAIDNIDTKVRDAHCGPG